MTGYQNLMKIVSKGFVEGFYYKPRVDMEVLDRYHEGIIALSACLAGRGAALSGPGHVRGGLQGGKAISRASLEKATSFLELQDHGIPDAENGQSRGFLRMSQELGMDPWWPPTTCHYIYAEDAAAHDILLCIQTGKKVSG